MELGSNDIAYLSPGSLKNALTKIVARVEKIIDLEGKDKYGVGSRLRS